MVMPLRRGTWHGFSRYSTRSRRSGRVSLRKPRAHRAPASGPGQQAVVIPVVTPVLPGAHSARGTFPAKLLSGLEPALWD